MRPLVMRLLVAVPVLLAVLLARAGGFRCG